MRYQYLAVFVLIAIIGMAIVFRTTSNNLPLYDSGAVDFRSATLFWEGQIRSYGGSIAYERLGTAMSRLTDGQKHEYAHIFGEALYHIEGVSGFSVCDTQYQSGCYHQFLGSAFADRGISSIQQFAATCQKIESRQVPGCFHGMGHAILSVFGYTPTDLNKALSLCDQDFTTISARKGCLDGVFMEYNIRDVISDGVESSSTARVYTPENRFTTCMSVDEQYRTACAYELPRWWMIAALTGVRMEDKAIQLGSWCGQMKEPLYMSCVRGIGFQLAAAISDPDTLIRVCTDASRDNDSREACLNQAARRQYMDHPKQQLLCEAFDLSTNELFACEKYATFSK
jgi:hypothetical protein